MIGCSYFVICHYIIGKMCIFRELHLAPQPFSSLSFGLLPAADNYTVEFF